MGIICPWGKSPQDNVILLGPKHTLRFEVNRDLLPCSTPYDPTKASAWFHIALGETSKNPLVLSGLKFPVDYEQACLAQNKPEYSHVAEGIGLIFNSF